MVKSPELTNQSVGRPVPGTERKRSLLIVNMTTCVASITPFDQWDTFNDLNHQNIPQNRFGVVADIHVLCVVGSMCGECQSLCRYRTTS